MGCCDLVCLSSHARPRATGKAKGNAPSSTRGKKPCSSLLRDGPGLSGVVEREGVEVFLGRWLELVRAQRAGGRRACLPASGKGDPDDLHQLQAILLQGAQTNISARRH